MTIDNYFLERKQRKNFLHPLFSILHSQFSIKHLYLLAVLLLASCASPGKLREEKITKPTISGDFTSAINNIEKNKKDLYNSEDAFLLEFDLGLLYHYNQDFQNSIKHLAKAEQILEELYPRSVTNEAAALLTNDNVRPYRSYPFEIQWMYQTQILNYLALGEVDEAVVEGRRAMLSQDKAGASLQYMIGMAYEWQKSPDDARIAYEDAKKNYGTEGFLPKLAAEVPENVAEHEEEIIIIGYAGISPTLRANEFWGTYAPDGALFLNYKDATGKRQTMMLAAVNLGGSNFSGSTMTLQFEIPQAVSRPSITSKFSVSVDGNAKQTETFANTNISLKNNLDSDMNTILLRTAARVVVRTIAASKAKSKMQTGSGILDLALNIGTDVATGAMEKADLRIGATMPGTLQIMRFPVEPGKHSVNIDILDNYGRKIGTHNQNVNIKKGEKVFLFPPSLR